MERVVEKRNIFFSWLKWHYFIELKEIAKKCKNVILFVAYYFSITLLLRTYLSPWKRYKWSYGRGFDFERYLEAAISNTFSRIIGAIIRTFVIIFGVLSLFVSVLFSVVVLLFWIGLPFLIIYLCLILI